MGIVFHKQILLKSFTNYTQHFQLNLKVTECMFNVMFCFQADREGVPPLQEVRRGRPPKRTLYKLHMGWLHYDENKKRYKQVHAKMEVEQE